MPVRILNPRWNPFAPMSDIKASIPPSPRLSARMTNRQYLTETVMIKVQTMSERMPMALSGVNWPPVACTTVCSVYNGLVPRSPNTTPKALMLAHWPARRPGNRITCRWVDRHHCYLTGAALLVRSTTVPGKCDPRGTNRHCVGKLPQGNPRPSGCRDTPAASSLNDGELPGLTGIFKGEKNA